MLTTRKWHGTWIAGTPGWIDTGRDWRDDQKRYTLPAPYLRKRFTLKEFPKSAVLYLASGGYHELYVNGAKADDRVLTPCVSQFDVHVNYLEYDLTSLLKAGENAITVILGNGEFNANTSEVWNFIHAAWRDFPRMLCDLVVDGELALKSDNTWKKADSPIVFDSFRSGETYDFSKEIPGVFEADFDDSAWQNAFAVRPVAGALIREDMEPCRVCQVAEPVEIRKVRGDQMLFDMGKNYTGWAEVELELADDVTEPLEVVLEFGEQLKEDGTAERTNIATFALDGWEHQIGRMYLTPGRKSFLWRPHFTYFGYRYIHLRCSQLDKIHVTRMQALFIHNDFPSLGNFTSSNATLNQLQEVTRQSFLTNFTGIPTDCPHREKNGWTGDHSLAMATGYWNYDALKAYKNFLQVFVDTQRPSGELAPIAPTAGWWWNCGPGWDYVLFQGAWEARRFFGDDSVIHDYYDAMRKYMGFADMMDVDGLMEYGLGDWCAPVPERRPSTRLTSSAWVFSMYQRMQVFAKMTGHEEDIPWYAKREAELRENILKEFLHADDTVEQDFLSSIACLVFFHICDDATAKRLADRLVAKVREIGHKCDFGIFGAKWIPRVLADYGYAEDALQIFLQPEYPGYVFMLKNGATTLWESFQGKDSRDHIMFGDLSAWCYEYLAGIQPRFDGPGFSKVELVPNVVSQLESFQAEHALPNGRAIKAGWKKENGKVIYTVELPEGTEATLRLPGKATQVVLAGQHSFEI